ncbi:MAG: hypothetical protein AAGK78_13805, partial [Planctomycetota bacterium]
RIGLRWQTPVRRIDAKASVAKVLRDEVGQLAEARAEDFQPEGDWSAGRVYVEHDPPGRDVWAGVSKSTGRIVQLVMHRPDETNPWRMIEQTLPSFVETPTSRRRRWKLFDLDITPPAGFTLVGPKAYRLAAGDLRLSFTRLRKIGKRQAVREPLVLRQVTPAKLALARRPMEDWLRYLAAEAQRFHKSTGKPEQAAPGTLVQRLVRRRRYGWVGSLPARLTATVFHDEPRGRLLLSRGPGQTGPRSFRALSK